MWTRLVGGAVMCLVGVVWFFQGVGTIKGSFMTDEGIWSFFGAIVFVIGVIFIRAARRIQRG